MKKLITLFAVLGLVLALAPAAQAASIFDDPGNELADPSIGDSQPAFNSTRTVDNIFDGSVENDNCYMVDSGKAFVNLDFGAETTVGGYVWYQNGDQGGDQVYGFSLIFSNSSDFSAPATTLTFALTGTPDFTIVQGRHPRRQEFEFTSPVDAQYVRYEVTDGQKYNGAGEMEFWAPPPPPTARC
jgi:hypothetical protein